MVTTLGGCTCCANRDIVGESVMWKASVEVAQKATGYASSLPTDSLLVHAGIYLLSHSELILDQASVSLVEKEMGEKQEDTADTKAR